jgi:sensor domain CHASE-containing protein
MLPLQFFSQNLYFAINLFVALTFFAVFWLQFDAWLQKRDKAGSFKWLGFLLVSIAFVVHATYVEQSVQGDTGLSHLVVTLSIILRAVGYIAIILGQVMDPLQKVPELKGITEETFAQPKTTTDTPASASQDLSSEPAIETQPEQSIETQTITATSVPASSKQENTFGVEAAETAAATAPAKPKPKRKPAKKPRKQGLLLIGGPLSGIQFGLPVGALAIGVLYWQRATKGLERHYKPVAVAFWLLTIYEVLSLGNLWQDSNNPLLARFVASYSPFWLVTQLVLLLVGTLLGRWVWRYLMRRFMSQLFMIFVMLTLAVFLFTTICFTFLLVNNIQNNSLKNLKTAASVLDYAVDSKKAETKARIESIAQSPDLSAAVVNHDRRLLQTLVSPILPSDKLSSLIVTSNSGQVLLRAEDTDRYGDSLSSDTTIRRALIGTASTTVTTKQGVLAPVVYIQSTAPIRDGTGHIVGAVIANRAIDNSFVDGIKNATGLDSAVYAGNVRSATTFVASDGISRWIGVKENNSNVRSTVLKKQQTYQGITDVQNQSYLAVYTPLKDVNNRTVGMLFIGQPQIDILTAAGHSVELTFMVTAILLILSIIPAFLVARYIAYQLD